MAPQPRLRGQSASGRRPSDMKYKPGSFSKSFAWGDRGLSKLQAAIRDGFRRRLRSVRRENFLSNCGIEAQDIALLSMNFFLHNKKDNRLSVDELVYQAISTQSSRQFNWLALFSFHLNQCGGSDPQPAQWANEYIRAHVWSGNAWRTESLQTERLDRFLDEYLDTSLGIRKKCRNNYKYILELCGRFSGPLATVNTEVDQWIISALFLAWDRATLDMGEMNDKELLDLCDSGEIHKLMGTSRSFIRDHARSMIGIYNEFGRLSRFDADAHGSRPQNQVQCLDSLTQIGDDTAVQRIVVRKIRQKRNRTAASRLKQIYGNFCMFCGVGLQVGEECYYSEAAHIKPLGKPYGGPDVIGNMLVLCMNHHLQYDLGVLRLMKTDVGFEIVSRIENDPLHGKLIEPRHSLDESCIEWHFNHWLGSA